MADSAGSDLTRHTAEVPLIDQHVHGCWLTEGNRRRFENALNEANTEPLADFDSGFDSQLGFAVRNHCAPILGLPRHVDPQTYWDRRSQFSEAELARRFLQAAGVTDWLVETGIGYDVSGMASVAGLGELSGSHAHEVVRLEQVAEQAVQASGDYASAFNEILRRRAATAVATKSILAYRGGFDGDLTEPPAAQVAEAAKRWRDRGGVRLQDRVLLRFGLHQALRLGKPLQFHVGFGDRDADLHKANPLYLLDFLRQSGNTPIVLLHCYPYEREAGYLAQAFNNVYLDGGLSVHYLGGPVAGLHRPTTGACPLPQDRVLVGRIRPRGTALSRCNVVAQWNSACSAWLCRARRLVRDRCPAGGRPNCPWHCRTHLSPWRSVAFRWRKCGPVTG